MDSLLKQMAIFSIAGLCRLRLIHILGRSMAIATKRLSNRELRYWNFNLTLLTLTLTLTHSLGICELHTEMPWSRLGIIELK